MSLTDRSCAVRRRLWHTCMKLVRCSILLFIGGSYPSSRGARPQMWWPHSQNISYYDQILPIPGILRSTGILSSIMSKQAEFAGVFTIVSCLGIRPVFSFLASGRLLHKKAQQDWKVHVVREKESEKITELKNTSLAISWRHLDGWPWLGL